MQKYHHVIIRIAKMVSASTERADKPHHPPSSFKFPTRKYGSRDRSCQHSWFSEFDFLH